MVEDDNTGELNVVKSLGALCIYMVYGVDAKWLKEYRCATHLSSSQLADAPWIS